MAQVTAVVVLHSDDVAVDALEAFAALGFQTTVVAGGQSILISGDRRLFASVFGVQVDDAESGGFEALAAGRRSRRLPLDRLPSPVKARVAAIEFEAPIEFGPTDY